MTANRKIKQAARKRAAASGMRYPQAKSRVAAEVTGIGNSLSGQTPSLGESAAAFTRILARFSPQAWINDYAVEVDPQGETEWDATVAFGALSLSYRERVLADGLDIDDALKGDPAAPEWVRHWQGPFSIYVEQYYDPADYEEREADAPERSLRERLGDLIEAHEAGEHTTSWVDCPWCDGDYELVRQVKNLLAKQRRIADRTGVTGPYVRAEAHDVDHVYEVEFDAAPWLVQADPEDIQALVDCGWGEVYPACGVARFCEEGCDLLGRMFEHVEREDVGFECQVGATQALAWLRVNRPEVLTQVHLGELPEHLRAFFEVEIRNEREGGVSPATLGSALDSWDQAPDGVRESWCGFGPYADSEAGRMARVERMSEIRDEIAGLVSFYGADTVLATLL